MTTFGPVPSRRLGQSLGINNIPPKVCTYSCVYCQIGRTNKMQVDRTQYYARDRILKDIRIRVEQVSKSDQKIDYLSFVPDGEPTLDINLGQEVEMAGQFGIRTAVITNSSLLWREDVRKDLLNSDCVSVKVDTVREETWRKINHPHRKLTLDAVLEGILDFSKIYKGELTTETMLVKGLNDQEEHLEEIARYLSQVNPSKGYLAIPIRPPAENYVRSPAEEVINRSFQIFSECLNHVEYLIGYEGNAFAFTGNVKGDILSITAVHPMREDAVRDFLERSNAGWEIIQDLLSEGELIEINYAGRNFYLRKFRKI